MNGGLRILLAYILVAVATGVSVRSVQAGVLFSLGSSASDSTQRCGNCTTMLAVSVHSQHQSSGVRLSGVLSFEGTLDSPRQDRNRRMFEKSCDASGRMSTTVDSLSVAPGSGRGSAVVPSDEFFDFDLRQVSSPAEAKTRAPSGPCWRWFRPPRRYPNR